MEKEGVFREKAIKRLSNPEELSEYLHVTNPSVWVILGAVIFIILGLFIWSYFTSVQSFVYCNAVETNGMLVISFDNQNDVNKVQEGMEVKVGDVVSTISSIAVDSQGDTIAISKMDIPDGSYENVKVCYRQVQVLSLLFE